MTHCNRLVSPLFILLLPVTLAVPGLAAKDPKLAPSEVVAKHLASIGSAEALAAVKSRAVSGTGTVVFRLGGHGQMQGAANVLSEGGRTRIGINFNTADYPGEFFTYDGKDVLTGMVKPGARSTLSTFVHQFEVMMKEGLLGGALSTAWALLDVTGRQPKLDYAGLKKVEGKQVHELKYRAKKGGDLVIFLSFEPESFRHVMTQYRLIQPAGMASNPADSSSMRDSRYTLTETFGDFRPVDGLTLPHSYKLGFTVEAQNGSFLADWTIVAEQIVNNATIDPKLFSLP